MSVAIITDTEARTNYQLENPQVQQAFGSSPYISDFFIWDTDTDASGYMSRQILPYSEVTGLIPYRLYVSGGNGSAINIDLWIGVNPYRNMYAWINATMNAGQDYIQPYLTLVNLGPIPIQANDVNFGMGSLDTFMKYNPYWSWLRLSNGTTVYEEQGFNDTVVTNASSYYVYVQGQRGFANGVNPQALLWTGFRTPEFADGFLIQPQSPSSVEEIDYVSNFFGHSIRIVNNLNGVVLQMGQQTTSFSFKFTTLAKTLWTEPNVLIDVFLNHVVNTQNGIDMSLAGTWGFDSYALAYWGMLTNNQTVLSFAAKLWNSQYADASQRLHPPPTFYNPTQQPVIYYRSLFLMSLAGLILYPNNATTAIWAQNVATYAIQNQLTPYGLPFGLEEDGWAVALLGDLTGNPFTSGQQAITYNGFISYIERYVLSNTTFVPQTPSSWSLTSPSYLSNTPSVWNLNGTGGVNAWCNHPQNVFRCGELDYTSNGLWKLDPSLRSAYWDSPASLASMSEFWMMTVKQTSGYSIDARYADNSGNSNTETDPVSLMGMLAWMQAMQNATGTFVSNLQGAGLSKIIPQISNLPGATQDIIFNFSVPAGASYNFSLNIADLQFKSGTLQVLYRGTPVPYSLDTSNGANDIVITGISDPGFEISWQSLGTPTNSIGCNPLPPTLFGQLEAGCLFPAIVNTFGNVVGIPWFIGITVGLVAGMIYLKTENSWIPLIILIAIAPVIGFLLPSQFSGIVYLIVVVAIAGLLYQGFKSRGS